MAVYLPPVPREPIGESQIWRDWFLKIRDAGFTLGGLIAGVSAFNGRAGAVTLTSSDVNTAMGFTVGPGSAGVASFNGRSGVVGLTSTDVTSALTYTPVSSVVTDNLEVLLWLQ